MKKELDPEVSKDIERLLTEIGSKVREHRKVVYKNYEDFAKDYSINKVTISRLENGENFTMSILIQVLRALDISLEDFKYYMKRKEVLLLGKF